MHYELPLSLAFGLVVAATLGSNPPFAMASLWGRDVHHHEEQASRVLKAAVVGRTSLRTRVAHMINIAIFSRPLSKIKWPTLNSRMVEYMKLRMPWSGWEFSLQSGRDRVLIPEGTVIYSDEKMDVKGKRLNKANQGKNGFVRRNLQEEDVVEEHTPDEEQELKLALCNTAGGS